MERYLPFPTGLNLEPGSLGSHSAPAFTSCVNSGLQAPHLWNGNYIISLVRAVRNKWVNMYSLLLLLLKLPLTVGSAYLPRALISDILLKRFGMLCPSWSIQSLSHSCAFWGFGERRGQKEKGMGRRNRWEDTLELCACTYGAEIKDSERSTKRTVASCLLFLEAG